MSAQRIVFWVFLFLALGAIAFRFLGGRVRFELEFGGRPQPEAAPFFTPAPSGGTQIPERMLRAVPHWRTTHQLSRVLWPAPPVSAGTPKPRAHVSQGIACARDNFPPANV